MTKPVLESNPTSPQGVPEAAYYAPVRLSFDLPESLAHITHLRKASRCYVESIGLSKDDADDLEMLLGELSTNVVRHAKAGAYHVSIEFQSDKYILHVIDKGVGFNPEGGGSALVPCTLRPDSLSETGEERIGGMGMVMIRAIADQVDIHPTDPQGTTVRAEKAIKTLHPTLPDAPK